MDDHLLPDGAAVGVLKEMHFVEDDDTEVVEGGRPRVDHVAQHLRRHHDRRGITVDGVVAGQQPDFAGAIAVGEVAELLVRERLQRRRVKRPSAAPAHHLDAVLGDDRLAAAGRGGNDDVAAGVDGVDRFELKPVELERIIRQHRRLRLAHVDDYVAATRSRAALRRWTSRPMPMATKYSTSIGPASAASEIGSPDGVITAASTTMPTIA